MRIRTKYKVARRLGADLFEKTQTQKFAMRLARRGKGERRAFGKSDFALQLREKQRARVLYGVNERQFSRYVRSAIAKRTVRDDQRLFEQLERRLDNVIYRLGMAPTRQAARQLVSHGHLMLNGVRVTTPSHPAAPGDVIRIREESRQKAPLRHAEDAVRDARLPEWLRFSAPKHEATVVGVPKLVKNEAGFDVAAVLEFYRR